MENGWYDSISLSDYLGVVWRRKWIVVIVTVLVAAAAALYARHEQTLYSATATVIAQSQNQGAANAKATSATWASDNQGVVNQLGLARQIGAQLRHALGSRPAATLAGQVSATPNAAGNGLLISAHDPSSTNAILIANAYAGGLGNYIQDTLLNGPNGLRAKASAAYAQLNADDAAYLHAKSTNNAAQEAALSSKAAIDQQTLRQINSQITTIETSQPTATQATSATQTQPKLALDVAIGAALGFVVGIVLGFLQDLLDTRVRSSDEVGRRLRLPLLAKVPQPVKGAGAVAMLDEPSPRQRPVAEAYRILKLNLLSALRARGVRTVMLTASGDNEGTSTVAANLAVVLARNGMHVVLVDANLRTPSLHRLFGLDAGSGLADVVEGRARLTDVLRVIDVEHHTEAQARTNGGGSDGLLELLPAGTSPADSADLLDNRVATALLNSLRDRADIVLIDAPAALPTTDAMVLATKVDAVIAIARNRLASRPQMVALRQAVANVPALAIGFVFTGTSAKERLDYGGGYAVPESGLADRGREPGLAGVAEATLR